MSAGAESFAALAPFVCRRHLAWLATPQAPRWEVVDGSLLFVDISGFTPLTERLARRGKAGGEELTVHLSRVFGQLIAAFDARGGDIVKFGGDALLVLFEGDDHPQQAAAAAWEAQQVMRPFRRLETSTGIVRLEASAGVASGPILVSLGGSAFSDFLISGPTLTAALDAESSAEAGQVLVDPSMVPLLGPRATREVDGGAMLARLPAAPPPRPPAARPPAADPRLGLPTVLHDALLHAGHGEHRMGVVAFLQFRGADDLLALDGPAAAAAALDRLLTDVIDACERYDVTFVTTDADRAAGKILLVAGAPLAGEDDADRMLRVLSEVTSQERRLTVRAGANWGRVFMTNLGAPSRYGWTTMGDATNLAARVMGKAPDGAVLATQALLDRLRDPVAHTPVPPFTVKGKTTTVQASVLGAVGDDAAVEVPAARLGAQPQDAAVPPGRDEQASVLDAALGHAPAPDGSEVQRAVELAGPAGIGKSRLVRYAIARAEEHGIRVVLLEGGRYGRHAAYLATRTPLRELLGIPRSAEASVARAALLDAARAHVVDADDWVGLLGPLVGLDLPLSPRAQRLEPEAARQRRHFAGAELVQGLIGERPALFIVEDAQWLDDLSGQLLVTLLAGSEERGWAGISSRRPLADEGLTLPEELEPVRVEVGPLPPGVVRSLILRALDRSILTPDAVPALIERAGGNPLHLEGLTAALAAGGSIDELPGSIEAALAVEIDQLPAPDRTALRELSVLGRWMPVATAAAYMQQTPDALLAFVRRLDAIVETNGDALWFRRGLQRDAAYEALSFRRRAELHARAADVLLDLAHGDPDEDLEVLAVHAHYAGRSEEAWRWCRRAGERALARGGPTDALAMFDWAAQAAAQVDGITSAEHGELLELRGDAAERAGRYDTAGAAYGAARRHRRSEPLVVAELCRKQARMCERQGRYSQALGWATRGRSALADHPAEPARDAALGALDDVSGTARLRQGRAADALRYLQRAVDRLEHTADRSALAHASYILAGALVELGRLEESAAPSLRAFELYEEVGDLVGAATVLNNLGVDAYWTGDWAQAADYLERGRTIRVELGDVALTAESELNLAELRSDQGRWQEAELLLTDAVAIFRAAPRPEGVGLGLSDLGRVASRVGDLPRAAGLFEEALDVLRGIGADGLAYEVEVREAERLTLAAAPAAALEAVAQLRATAAGVAASHFYRCALARTEGWALAQLGRTAEAGAALQQAVDLAREQESRYEEAVSLDALATACGDPAVRRAADALLGELEVIELARPPLTA